MPGPWTLPVKKPPVKKKTKKAPAKKKKPKTEAPEAPPKPKKKKTAPARKEKLRVSYERVMAKLDELFSALKPDDNSMYACDLRQLHRRLCDGRRRKKDGTIIWSTPRDAALIERLFRAVLNPFLDELTERVIEE